ncbi:MAG: hypothetical protein K0R14_990 [Burkholderiales bacterium]|jgi:hypothetical protein|nr:hypothetical protein [Burkholderiales bacterium]
MKRYNSLNKLLIAVCISILFASFTSAYASCSSPDLRCSCSNLGGAQSNLKTLDGWGVSVADRGECAKICGGSWNWLFPKPYYLACCSPEIDGGGDPTGNYECSSWSGDK